MQKKSRGVLETRSYEPPPDTCLIKDSSNTFTKYDFKTICTYMAYMYFKYIRAIVFTKSMKLIVIETI